MKFKRLLLFAICATFGLASLAASQPAPGSFTVGVLWPVGACCETPPAFVKTLRDLGYKEGVNLTVIGRGAKTSNAELPPLAAELASLKPDVLVAISTPPSLALKNATTKIPILALNVADPIGSHLVQSLAHPGGNVTGIANGAEQWVAKRFEAVTEVLPGIRCVLALRNPENQSLMMLSDRVEALAAKLGFVLRQIDVGSVAQLDKALGNPPDEDCKTAMSLPLDTVLIARRAQIADYALRYRIALFAPFREDAEAGALMSFGIDLDDQWRLGAAYVGKILKGAKPEDLPVQQPTKFEIVINLKTAKALGLTIPQSILAQADRSSNEAVRVVGRFQLP